MLNPYASFDCLSVATRLERWTGSVTEGELHLFSYLACLLSLYRMRPVTDWGYQYVGTKLGAPYGPAIGEAIKDLIAAGLIDATDQVFRITSNGRQEYETLRTLVRNSQRDAYLEGACSSVLALPIGLVREAILQEPELSRSRRMPITRTLLEDGPGLNSLYEHFSTLSTYLGVDTDDLMVPSAIWLTYLAQASLIDDM